jgi:hypothetical protein
MLQPFFILFYEEVPVESLKKNMKPFAHVLSVVERQDMELGIAFFVGRGSWNPILGSNFTMRRDSKFHFHCFCWGRRASLPQPFLLACNPTSKIGGKA